MPGRGSVQDQTRLAREWHDPNKNRPPFNFLSQVRVRFAPSPTGYLHVGGARTALFNWLFARHEDGVFILRIEDTDRERSNPEMTRAILEGMAWLGLRPDEEPAHQADGLERHRRDVQRLIERGVAYRCFCSPEDLDARSTAAGVKPDAYRYDRFCLRVEGTESTLRAAAGEPFVVRLRVPPGETAWDDAVHGRIAFDNGDIEDFIILRTDGTPIYNMAVVSDDVAMRITHVLRGDDHISNTPKQIMLYQGLSAPLPVFGHVPMILGPDGRRLSKRHGATAIGEYRTQGILPAAMVNFLALLGWSPGEDREIFSMAELVERFTLQGINRKSAIFDSQKLLWLNGQHLNQLSAEALEPLVCEALEQQALPVPAANEWFHRLIDLLKVRARTVRDIALQAAPYLSRVSYDPEAVSKYWKDAGAVADRLGRLRVRLGDLAQWDEESLERALRGVAEADGTGAGKYIHPLRVALTGAAVSPGIFEVAALMGRERVLERIDEALLELRRPA